MKQQLKEFIKLEASSGILLIIATILALLFSNSPLKPYYLDFLDIELIFSFGQFSLHKPLLLWINDGLMPIFFLLVALELKREIISGHLTSKGNIILPTVGALGGLICPALVFYYFNQLNTPALQGWAIPTATDTAFALGVLSLLSNRIPKVAKLFLMTLAIFDDLAALIIIAIFYTTEISWIAICFAIVSISSLLILNRFNVQKITPYAILGLILWLCVLKSGVHATLAGVITAFFIPINKKQFNHSPLHRLEHELHPWVAFVILPLFAFANAGLEINADMLNVFYHSVTLGTSLGLLIGKQVGVFTFCIIALKIFNVKIDKAITIPLLYGLSALTGIGFTMSLFISSLAYAQNSHDYMVASRLGILIGSIGAATFGYLVLRLCTKPKI